MEEVYRLVLLEFLQRSTQLSLLAGFQEPDTPQPPIISPEQAPAYHLASLAHIISFRAS